MSALLWIPVGLLLLLLLLLCLPVGAGLSYGEGGLRFRVRCFGIWISLPPGLAAPTGAGKQKKPKKQKKQKQGSASQVRKPGSAADFCALLPIIGDALGKLRARLSIDELTLWYLSAAEDPFAAAMGFGGASAAAAALRQPLEQLFRIRKWDVKTAISFTETKPRVYVCLRLSVSPAVLLWLGLRFLHRYGAIRKSRQAQEDTVPA